MPNKRNLFLLAPLVASACVEPELASIESAVEGGSTASAFHIVRAAYVSTTAPLGGGAGCTGTRISQNFVLTAHHCTTAVGDTIVNFYGGVGQFPDGRDAQVVEVISRPGVPSSSDCGVTGCSDSSGAFADIKLLRLSSAEDTHGLEELDGPQATLAWEYPGEDVSGIKVGAGSHNDEPNTARVLRQIGDTTDSTSDRAPFSPGSFITTLSNLNHGDSGGPFYVNQRVLGVASGYSWGIGSGEFNRMTSVPYHLHWILGQIGYRWRGQPALTGTRYTGGTVLGQHAITERACQYACERTATCDAYNYNTSVDVCELRGNPTGASTDSAYRSALRRGTSSGRAGYAVGYVQGTSASAVVHETSMQHIHELELETGKTWEDSENGVNPPVVSGKLSAYRRADGVSAVVYRSGNRVIEIALAGGGWQISDLTSFDSARTAAGDPVAYVRDDGVDAVVYRDANGHIQELRRATRGWLSFDITNEASAAAAHSDPSAYVRSDGISSIVYRSGTEVHELYRQNGVWAATSLTVLTGAASVRGQPFGYTRRDGTNSVVYRSTADRIIELWLDSTGWHRADLTSLATAAQLPAGNPVAYVRSDAIDAVVYRAASGDIIELTNTPWQDWSLTDITGAAAAATDPSVYVRHDGYNAVVFEASNGHVVEIAGRRGTPWADFDLTLVANEVP